MSVWFLVALTVSAFGASGEDIWSRYLAGEDPQTVREQFQQALESDPHDAYAAAGLGFVEDSRCRTKEALQAWIAATESFGDDPVAELFLHLAFEVADELALWDDFVALCRRLEEKRETPDSLLSTARFYRAMALRRQGKVAEAQALVAEFKFIQDFLVCGPFDNAEKRGHDRRYGPEESFDPDATYAGRNRKVSWEQLPVRSAWGYVDLKAFIRPAAESSTYLAAVIAAEHETRARLLAGHAGALKAWINGTPAIDSNRYHGPFPDQVASQIELRKGNNLLLLKVSSGETGKYGVWVRLAPLEGSDADWQILPAGKGTRQLPRDFLSVTSADVPAFDREPPAVAAMRQSGPNYPPTSPRHFFYALLVDQLDIVDEADQSEILTLTRCLESYPESAILRFYAARADRERNRQRRFLRECIERDPLLLRARLALIDSFRGTPFRNRLRQLIDQALQVAPQEVRFVVRKARLLADEGLQEGAVGCARYAVETDANLRETWWYLAELGAGLIPRAERFEIYKRLVNRDASDLDALSRLVRMSLADGDESAGRKWIEQTLVMDPWRIEPIRALAEFKLARGENNEALKVIEGGLKISPHDPDLHRLAAMALQQRGDTISAVSHIAAILAAAPSDPWALDYRKHISPEAGDYYTPYRRRIDTLPEPDPQLIARANYVTLLHQEVKRVHPNGNSSRTVHQVIRVLTDAGLRALQSRGIYYEPATEEVRVLRSRVWKRDGTFVDSPAPYHRSTASAGDAAARLYGDYNVAILTFPALEKGATIELEYQVEQKGENIYADYFGDIFVVGDYEPTVLSEYILITPLARDIYYSFTPARYPPSVATGRVVMASEPEEYIEGRQRIQRWVFENLPLVPREPYMPQYSEILPYLKVSTFRMWEDMTTWWWNLSKDQLIPGPTVKNKVEQIIAEYRGQNGLGPEDPISDFEKVRIVNSFVNTDVRYLGLEFGIHGYKPHRVDEICQAQYGDCKDKAALALAMLKELGVDAYMVILRTTDRGEIDYQLPMLGMFNHAIYYVPDVDGREYWIDGTATFFDTTELPWTVEGANSLIVEPGGRSYFKRIPTSPAADNGGEYHTYITLDPDGKATGKRVADYQGLYNPMVRMTYENRAKAKDLVEQQLVSRYPGGRCLYVELSDLEDYSTPERLTYEFEIPNYATPQGNQLSMPAVFFPQNLSRRYAPLSKREYDLVLPYRWHYIRDMVIKLPEGWRVTELPPSAEEETPFGLFRWSGSVEGRELHLTGELQVDVLRVSPQDYQAFRAFCQRVDNYEERRILLRQVE